MLYSGQNVRRYDPCLDQMNACCEILSTIQLYGFYKNGRFFVDMENVVLPLHVFAKTSMCSSLHQRWFEISSYCMSAPYCIIGVEGGSGAFQMAQPPSHQSSSATMTSGRIHASPRAFFRNLLLIASSFLQSSFEAIVIPT